MPLPIAFCRAIPVRALSRRSHVRGPPALSCHRQPCGPNRCDLTTRPHACPSVPTGDHASCDHTATTDGDGPAPSAAPDDSRPQRRQQVLPVVVMEEIERLRWALSQIIALADEAPGLTDEQLRERLLTLATRHGGKPR
jgi:hypothetical protein